MVLEGPKALHVSVRMAQRETDEYETDITDKRVVIQQMRWRYSGTVTTSLLPKKKYVFKRFITADVKQYVCFDLPVRLQNFKGNAGQTDIAKQ